MNQWLDDLALSLRRGHTVISVAVVSTKGSVPRNSGTRMLVTPTEVIGTIGGGHLEFKAIQIARDLLASSGVVSLMRFPLGASLGQCCGGLVNLLFEPVRPPCRWVDDLLGFQREGQCCIVVTPVRGDGAAGKLIVAGNSLSGSLGSATLEREATAIAKRQLLENQRPMLLAIEGEEYFFERVSAPDFNVILFGAGHVGRALVRILAELPCNVTWIDSREEEFPVVISGRVAKVVSDAPEMEVAGAPAGSYFLVMTHSHQLDQAISERILQRQDFAYFGLIGSLSKRQQFERRMLARGISAHRFDEMTCPIGAGRGESKEPMAIAISVAGELLERRDAMQHGKKHRIARGAARQCENQ